jgi:hypothetical protein
MAFPISCFNCGPQINCAARVGLMGRGAPGWEQDLDKEQRECCKGWVYRWELILAIFIFPSQKNNIV